MNKEHWRRYMEALGEEWEDLVGRHLDEEELIAYGRRQLEAVEAERLQSHLVRCDRCLTAFKGIMDFFGELREGEEPVSEREIRREWDAFRRRVQAPAAARKSVGLWIGPRAIYALAASLLVAVGLVTFWGLRLRQDVQQMARQWQAEHARREAAEQHARRLQQQNDALAREYESQLAELRQPQWNIPVYDILSREAFRRSGIPHPVNRITLPPTAGNFTVILTGTPPASYPEYEIEILDSGGRVHWRGTNLRRDPAGNFTLLLSRSFLGPGEYRIRLYGRRHGRSRYIAEYIIVLTNP